MRDFIVVTLAVTLVLVSYLGTFGAQAPPLPLTWRYKCYDHIDTAVAAMNHKVNPHLIALAYSPKVCIVHQEP